MDRAEYIAAFRFGFGLNVQRNERFDPRAELAAPLAGGAPLLDELAEIMVRDTKGYAEVVSLRNTNPDKYLTERKAFARLRGRADNVRNHGLIARAVLSTTPFLHRLSAFWINHFSLGKLSPGSPRLAAGFYEQAAIWPNLTGNFAELLIAAELFPAMVFYLNLQTSIGPNSILGKRRNKGINENLGREILELHTLGADGGYTQADVTALAMIMTGWHVSPGRGRTVFDAKRAEPGAKTLLGRTFGEGADSQFHDALRMLARHPATARHIGRKLVLHFLGPGFDREAEAVAQAFLDNEGALTPVYETLLDVAADKAEGRQMRNDFQFLVSALRSARLRPGALELPGEDEDNPRGRSLTIRAMRKMTQELWAAPTPQGWSDDPAFWLSPPVMARRLQWLPELVKEIQENEPDAVLEAAVGPLATANTRRILALASNRLEAIGLVYASPEFNRR